MMLKGPHLGRVSPAGSDSGCVAASVTSKGGLETRCRCRMKVMGGKGVALVDRGLGNRRLGPKPGVAVLLAASLVLSSCQSLFEQAYVPSVGPSDNPQIVDQVHGFFSGHGRFPEPLTKTDT